LPELLYSSLASFRLKLLYLPVGLSHATAVACRQLGWKEFQCWLLGLLPDLYASLFLPYGFDACSREPVPSTSRLIKGVCSLSLSIQQACLVYGLYKGVCSLCFFIQLACLAFVLVKGLCSLFPVLLVSSAFLIYNILTFDKKKKKSSQSELSVSSSQ